MTRAPPQSTLFPYPTLFRSGDEPAGGRPRHATQIAGRVHHARSHATAHLGRIELRQGDGVGDVADRSPRGGDRKSTRLNSSHPSISYAVFCLKKKKCNTNIT